MDEQEKSKRIEQARAEIAARIKPYCTDLDEEEFQRLLDRMTGVHLKFDVYPHLPETEIGATNRESGDAPLES